MGSLKGFVPVTPPVKGKGAESTAAPRAIDMVTPWPVRDWAPEVAPDEAAAMRTALERGNVLHFPTLAFPLDARERRFLDARWSDGKTKNINCGPTRRTCAARWATRPTCAISPP